MVKSSNRVVIKNEEGKILEIPAESFDIEKYINSTILDYKYILEIDGNEMNFPNSIKRTEFLKTINNCLNKKAQKSFNIFDFPIIEVELDADNIKDFHECLAAIKRNGKWGFIDKTGKAVIPCIYDNTCSFSEGLATVNKNDKWGFIDKTGKEVVPFEYDYICAFHEGLASAHKNDKWGIIDKTGKVVIPIEYNAVSYFFDGLVRVIKDGKTYFINKKNQKLNLKLTGYALDFQDDNRVLFNSIEEIEEFIKLLDETISIDPYYNDDNANEYQKKLK